MREHIIDCLVWMKEEYEEEDRSQKKKYVKFSSIRLDVRILF